MKIITTIQDPNLTFLYKKDCFKQTSRNAVQDCFPPQEHIYVTEGFDFD